MLLFKYLPSEVLQFSSSMRSTAISEIPTMRSSKPSLLASLVATIVGGDAVSAQPQHQHLSLHTSHLTNHPSTKSPRMHESIFDFSPERNILQELLLLRL